MATKTLAKMSADDAIKNIVMQRDVDSVKSFIELQSALKNSIINTDKQNDKIANMEEKLAYFESLN